MENLKQVTKNPKKVEAGKKGYQARLLKLKEEILAGSNPGTISGTSGSNPGTISGTSSLVLFGTGSNPGTIFGTSGSNPGTISGTTITFSICLIAILAVGLFYNFKKPKQAEKPEHIKKIRPNL